MAGKSFVFIFGDVEVREREFSIVKVGEVFAVEPKAFRVLLHLLRNPQKLIPKEELLNAVWGETAVSENSLTRSIALLRRLLGDEARDPRFIETVATVGYRWVCKVQVSEEESSEAEPLPAPSRPRRLLLKWLIPSASLLFAGLALAALYFFLPLPLPRVTAYNQITHDGHIGFIAGTDESRIFFNMYPWGPAALVGVTGGDIVNMPTGFKRAEVAGVSADGASLLVWSYDPTELWTMGTVGGPPRFLGRYAGDTVPAWSPDAKYIAYADSGGTLFTMSNDGTDVRKLATVKGDISDIAWSPDDSHIRFTVTDVLWEISSTGADLHQLLPGWKGPVGQCCGRWTQDGAFYLFLAGGNNEVGANVGGFEQIWILDERRPLFRRASQAPTQLTSGPIHWGVPIPSRDGRKVFTAGTIPRGELVRFDPQSKRLQPFLGGVSAEFVDLSKDRTQIAYVTYPDGILWRAKPDGTERVQLTSPPLYPILCRWSPDGTQILFTAQRDASRYGLYTVPAQGGNPRLLVPADDGMGQADGYWSPDSHRIAYTSGSQGSSLRIFDLNNGKSSEIPGSNDLFSPRWSPDGRYIAAMTTPVSSTIKLFDLHTQQWSTLTEHTGPWGFPSWSHDGKFIYALNGFGKWSVQRISVPDGKAELVLDLSEVHLIGAVAFWFGLDPNDSPLLLRDNGTSDIYALTLDQK